MLVDPRERGSYYWALMPAPRYDFAADGLSGAAQRLAHHGGLVVSCPPPQEVDTANADADLGVVSEPDEGFFRPALSAAPAAALLGLGCRCWGLSGHDGSLVLPASVGRPTGGLADALSLTEPTGRRTIVRSLGCPAEDWKLGHGMGTTV
jgi:hypothetical protein